MVIEYTGPRNTFGEPVMANYEMEDYAAKLLYDSHLRFKKPEKVDAVRLALCNGLSVRSEFISDSPYSLCAVALVKQTLIAPNGNRLVMAAGDIVVERALDHGGRWYSYAVLHGISHIFLRPKKPESAQLMFDLGEIQSKEHCICDYGELADIFTDPDLDSRPQQEAQADVFAGCLMLPKGLFKTAANTYLGNKKINRADLKGEVRDEMITYLSDLFCAPEVVVALRLKKLLYL